MWDPAGQERFRNITSNYYRGSNGVIVVYDVTDRSSFEHIGFWFKEVEKSTTENMCKLIVANKVDKENRAVSKREGKMLASQYGVDYIETSAFSGKNVEKMFQMLTLAMQEMQNTKAPEATAAKSVELPITTQTKQVEKEGCC